MIVEITGSCGHTSDKELTNASGSKEIGSRTLKKSIAYWSTKECTNCWKVAKQTETANKLAPFGTLSELTVGSEAQIKWATRIREQQLIKIASELDISNAVVAETKPDGTPIYRDGYIGDSVNWEEVQTRIAALTQVTSAKFWIETKTAHSLTFVKEGALNHSYEARIMVKVENGTAKALIGKQGESKVIQWRNRTIRVGGTKVYWKEVA
tara:strand:+ start:254 stop:883 length:630 start_codon:yes stop_codon:yes gene_type:complete